MKFSSWIKSCLVWLILLAILGGAVWTLVCRFNQDHWEMDAFLDRAHPLLRPGSSPGPSSLGDSSFPSSSLAPALPGSQERGTYRYKATTQAVFYLDGEEVFSLKLYLGQPEVQFSLVAKPSVVFATSQDRGIAFIDSDCPDKVCVHTGVLRASNSMAACLPNRLILVLEPINSD